MEERELKRFKALVDPARARRDPRAGRFTHLLDNTQGHLILRWNAWRPPRPLREIGLPAVYCLVALVFLLSFAIESFRHFHPGHAQVLLGFALLTVACYLYQRLSGNRQATNIILVILLGALCLFLLYTGGIGGTGPLWYFVFPLFALFVLRLWAGLMAVILLLAVTVFLFWHPVAGFHPAQYSADFRERFLAVYTAVSLMAFFYAFTRASSELELSNLAIAMHEMANTDVLTRLPNRRRMLDVLYQEVGRTRRGHGVFSLIMMDLDHFKSLNDRHGHDCGDAVLRALPAIAHGQLRTQDVFARWGGEEFLVLLPGTALDGATQVGERLRAAVAANPVQFEGRELKVTASFGVAEFRPDDDLDACIGHADSNLYLAKSGGRNRVVAG